jgi:hypothetical protein
VSLTIEATTPSSNGPRETPDSSGPVTRADFAATLRDFTELDDTHVAKRFARLNAMLRTNRPAYPDPVGCRSWLVW